MSYRRALANILAATEEQFATLEDANRRLAEIHVLAAAVLRSTLWRGGGSTILTHVPTPTKIEEEE
jgi:hypothetical protein